MPVHLFGIRHHGPGSARSLSDALDSLKPDAILVEGPPEAEAVLPLASHAEMRPPVALLVYRPDKPSDAVYYPFAEFSPEWQALSFGAKASIPVRFMDLPHAYRFTLDGERLDDGRWTMDDGDPPAEDERGSNGDERAEPDIPEPSRQIAGKAGSNLPLTTHHSLEVSPLDIQDDPFLWVAHAAGYSDGERWWERLVEQRRDCGDLFAAIHELMTALREGELNKLRDQAAEGGAVREETSSESAGSPPNVRTRRRFLDPRIEDLREAYMRQSIRKAQRDGFERLAVVCGAWHTPALSELGPAKRDADKLTGLLKVKVEATWVPWTYDRLSLWSGYGAGIESPGYYHLLWSRRGTVSTHWMTLAAHLLREQDLDASPASVIEAIRLADALASLRDRSVPGLDELLEATESVLCAGSRTPLDLIGRKLVVGERLGSIPDETPMLPLQQDLLKEQKRLRLPPEAGERLLDLDLRKPGDLDRSRLLHRLDLLDIPWGRFERAGGGASTFHEIWRLQWQPELAVSVIEASIWGNTVSAAATERACSAAADEDQLPALTATVEKALLADLPDAIGRLMHRLENLAAITSDVPHLMEAFPPLVNVIRYGNVRGTDVNMVQHVVDGLAVRIAIGLPPACLSLNDDAAQAMFERIVPFDQAIRLLNNEEHLDAWRGSLSKIAEDSAIHGIVAGRCCRLLLQQNAWDAPKTSRILGLALSTASQPAQAAAWVEGFLTGSGLMLLHSDELWQIVDEWVSGLTPEAFPLLLPLLRRTFGTFPPPERRQMGERVKRGASAKRSVADEDIDHERAVLVLPILRALLGLPEEATI